MTLDVAEDERVGLLKEGDGALNVSEPSDGLTSMGVGTVALLVFFTVSGGPMGSEDAVGAVGPVLAIATYLTFPWIYALPVALVTGELSAQFPEDGGFTLWVVRLLLSFFLPN